MNFYNLKNELKINDIVEENDKIYIAIDNDKELLNVLKMEEAMCKIKSERIENNELVEGKGKGFFCEIDNEKLLNKYYLITNNHILNERNLEINNIPLINILKKYET